MNGKKYMKTNKKKIKKKIQNQMKIFPFLKTLFPHLFGQNATTFSLKTFLKNEASFLGCFGFSLLLNTIWVSAEC